MRFMSTRSMGALNHVAVTLASIELQPCRCPLRVRPGSHSNTVPPTVRYISVGPHSLCTRELPDKPATTNLVTAIAQFPTNAARTVTLLDEPATRRFHRKSARSRMPATPVLMQARLESLRVFPIQTSTGQQGPSL
jgi:hypothetical protein